MSNTILLMFLANNNISHLFMLNLNTSWYPNSRFTEQTWTHHHAAHLKLNLLFKISRLYVAEYNTDFTIGLLFLTDGTYRSYFERMMETARVDGPSTRTVEGTAFGLYLMHNANVLGHWGCVPPFFSPVFVKKNET